MTRKKAKMKILNNDLDYNDSPLLPFDRTSEPDEDKESGGMGQLVIGRSFDIRQYADDISDEYGSGELSTLNKVENADPRVGTMRRSF